MTKKINIFSWTKWVLEIIRAKYWFNLSLMAVVGLLVRTVYVAATAANCGPCAGLSWGMLAFFILSINLIVFFASEPDDFDAFWKMVFRTWSNFLKRQWNRITSHFNWWWKDKPKD